MLLSPQLSAQSKAPEKKAKMVDQNLKQRLIEKDEKPPEEVTYDTGETLGYLSSRVAYQLKKRLHLADEEDEEEEKRQRKKASKGKFTVFGIVVEKH